MNFISAYMCRIMLFFFLMLAGGSISFAQSQLDQYNTVWKTPSKNASGSMPCGGGDIGMNVWVEDGDLLVYITRSGSFNEDNTLMKSGRLRFTLSPNPFNGPVFKQELHLQEGYVTIEGNNKGVKAKAQIWVDVNQPAAHFDFTADKKIRITAAYESWRYRDRLITRRENFSNSWKWGPPNDKIYTKDEIRFDKGGILFYHQNGEHTIFDTVVAQQGMEAVKKEMYNPLKNLVFGGVFKGDDFIPSGEREGMYEQTDFQAWVLKTKNPGRSHRLTLILHNEQTGDIDQWAASLEKTAASANDKKAFLKSRQWWQQFWKRSFVIIDEKQKDSSAWETGRNFQLFRYMLGCNSRGGWPTKFNGGLFTVDPCYTDTVNKGLTPDYRNWGGGTHTAQNQRLVYFPMIKNGDWDLLQPQLDFYLRLLKNAELRSRFYWDHAGACFTEQLENFGLPNYAEYGLKRPADYDKGMEYNAWLEYEWDTVLEFCKMMLDEYEYTGKPLGERAAFIESCLRFFDEHYQYLAKKRGARTFDQEGKLVLYPGSGAETYKMATNSTSTISALVTVAKGLSGYYYREILVRLPEGPDTLRIKKEFQKTVSEINYLDSLLSRLPPVSFSKEFGPVTIAPARSWERINNSESPQLYPVFPWHLYGVGKPGLDTALNTWKLDTNVIKFRSYIGWKQDNIWAADLGLVKEAWELNVRKLASSGRRFPVFWGPGYDWVPDHNWGGSGMIGIQEMLLQTDGKRILLFPAWPKDKDVHFKLHAPYNTTVEAELKNGKIEKLIVLPEDRKKDVELFLK